MSLLLVKSTPRAFLKDLGLCVGLSLGLALGLAFAPSASAQIPAGYYDVVDTADSNALRSTLHGAIDDHQRFPYTSSSTDVWDILNMADEDPANTGRIIDLYKNASLAKISGGTGAYNREHVWPKSYGFPDDGSSNYPYTDCHHLFVADTSYNQERSNKPFRDCDSGCGEWTTNFTDGRGGGSGVYPGNSNWTSGDFYQGTWETWGGRKGDVARAIFYMDIRYEGGTHGGTGAAEPDLRLTDDENQIEAYRTGDNENVAYMGMRSVLLQWHLDDPVDAREIYRNEIVYSFQGNRNPFIDHPEWVDCLYNGAGCGSGGGGGGGACPDCVDFSAAATVSYSNQDNASNFAVQDGGATLYLEDNTWRRTSTTFEVTAATVLEFDFKSTSQGELHGIGFDEDDDLTNDPRVFKLHGTQNWSSDIDDAATYSGNGGWQSYSIPVGTYYTGASMRLVFMNDNDAGSGNTSFFRDVRLVQSGGGGGGSTLSNGVAATGLAGAQNEQTFFTLEVPAGASDLQFALSGGSGDGDLYVRFGAAPTTSEYDCRPWLTGSNETCEVTAQAGTWHVMVAGYSAYSGASLVGSFTAGGGGGCTPVTLDLSSLSGAAGDELRYTLQVPSCGGALSVAISGGSGDADLYVRGGSAPTTSTYDCRPYLGGNSETCSFQDPQAGTWHIMVRGYSAFSGVGLDASAQ